MLKRYLLLWAPFVASAVLVAQTASAQNAPSPKPQGQKEEAKDRPAAKSKDSSKDTSKPKESGQGGDARRESRKPVNPDAKDTRDDAKDRAKDTRDEAKDRTKDTRDQVKDRAKDTRDDVKDRTKDTRDTAKDRTKDRRDDAKDTAKDRRDDVRDTAKDRTKDRRDDAKDTAKDRTKDRRDDTRDTADTRTDRKDRTSDSKQARKFDAEKVKVDDLGISFKESDKGLAVSNITRSSVLADVGFQSGDRIVSINGQDVVRQTDFVRYLFAPDVVSVGRVPIIVLRDGVRETIYVEPRTIIRHYETVVVDERDPVRDFGIVLDDSYRDRLIVERVFDDSPAEHAGIRVDDEIVAVNDNEVATHRELARMMEKFEDERVEMEVRRERQVKVIEIRTLR